MLFGVQDAEQPGGAFASFSLTGPGRPVPARVLLPGTPRRDADRVGIADRENVDQPVVAKRGCERSDGGHAMPSFRDGRRRPEEHLRSAVLENAVRRAARRKTGALYIAFLRLRRLILTATMTSGFRERSLTVGVGGGHGAGVG